MDINKLLSGGSCPCGKTHTCDIKYVYIEPDATRHLSHICQNFDNILVVADENTFSAAGKKTLAPISGKNVKKLIFPGNKILVPNEATILQGPHHSA